MSDAPERGQGNSRPAATVSIDVDPVDLHLTGYGVRGPAPDDLVYRVAVPRLLDLLAEAGVRATFFVVGRDAQAQAPLLRRIAAAGHEIAGHSMTHPLGFRRMSPGALRQEIGHSKCRIEESAGTSVAGFRAPNFDLQSQVVDEVLQAGYRYDASNYPTPLLPLARAALALKSADRSGVAALTRWPWSLERLPHRLGGNGTSVAEFPVTVTPLLRWPLYHTLRYGERNGRFGRCLDTIAGRGEPLSYLLHAVDALGLEEDRVTPALAVHPGMNVSLARKQALIAETLAAITARFEPRPFIERI